MQHDTLINVNSSFGTVSIRDDSFLVSPHIGPEFGQKLILNFGPDPKTPRKARPDLQLWC